MVVVIFNTDLDAPEGQECEKDITEAMVEEGLEDIIGHFFPCHKPCLKDSRTWAIQRGGQEVLSQTDYIMGTFRAAL